MNGIHHITLTVSDVSASVDWYQQLLGEAQVIEREGDGWKRIRLNWPDGLVLSFTRHDASRAGEKFDHLRIGLDHIGLGCADEAEVRGWFDKLASLGFRHGPLEDAPYGWAVTARDPDNIAVEFFCTK